MKTYKLTQLSVLLELLSHPIPLLLSCIPPPHQPGTPLLLHTAADVSIYHQAGVICMYAHNAYRDTGEKTNLDFHCIRDVSRDFQRKSIIWQYLQRVIKTLTLKFSSAVRMFHTLPSFK